MVITYIPEKNRYVDSSGRPASIVEYGKDFYNCKHDFRDTGRRGTTIGINGKHKPAAALQCLSCNVYVVAEVRRKK